jgi:hypothetical protein
MTADHDAANTQKIIDDHAKKREKAKPTMSLLHHIAATQAMHVGFTVTLLGGEVYKADGGDFVFTDGLSMVHDKRRMYFPLTAIKSILIHNPGDK